MLRILIADDHAILRRGIIQIIREEYPSAFIKEAEDAETLIKYAFKEEWDIIISDMSMPGRSGIDALQQIKSQNPGAKVLILSVHPEEQYAIRVLKSGAMGYLNKEAAPEVLIVAIKKILLGRKYISTSIAEMLAKEIMSDSDKPDYDKLSNREFDVFKLLASGKSVSEIAQNLNLSVTTISTYRSRILEKLHLKSNSDLTKYAIENGLI